ncbi:D-alanyl-D-alanine carboxypeptidase [Bacillus sp. CLL-7-23]|uniref:D-alanyl-D-alanine carboxypeptidase n=1 Tax=Bacillus changyiensis TaxID=3004103 RepID=A0ABT4X5L6_9BACI|nr:D-alanyl-D-alanine carboxypeptidase family protein [Bacillus changyiensis]MDA7027475.1 D-alanyl-D-alanine carboxypeptidase [Bacillus changyiensis]
MAKKILLLSALLCMTMLIHKSAQAGDQSDFHIDSESVILIDAKSGQVVFEQNSNKKMYPASITKIATAIYAIEKGNLKDKVKISKKAADTEGTSVYLEEGETVPLKRLLQGLLMNSGNDAATAIAEYVSGSDKKFADQVNAFVAKRAGAHDTHFTNPHGLFDKYHYTTAADMAKITRYAMKNKTFRELFSKKQLAWKGKTWKTTLKNHHRMLTGEIHFQGITGGKTGYVDQSKHTLVTTATQGDLDLIAVVMKADSHKMMYNDTKTLLAGGFNHFETVAYQKGKQFKDQDGKRLDLKERLFVTKKKGETISEVLDRDGTLNIKGEDGRLIQSVNIRAHSQNEGLSADRTAVHEEEPHKSSGLFLFLTGFFGLLAISYVVKRLRQL